MSAFYFGSSDSPLFGVYHPPAERPVHRAGVLICNSLGREYMRTHRTLRQLAVRLTEAGYHVLRFDYSCSGDSAGRGRDATLRRWEEDAEVAAEELKAVGGVRRVSVVGVRLGAAVAASLAARHRDVDDVVLWDPVVRGESYLSEVLDGGPVAAGARSGEPGSAAPRAGEDGADGTDVVGAGGFAVGRAMLHQIGDLDLGRLDRLSARRALLVVTEEREAYRALGRRLEALIPSVRLEHRPGAEGWEDPGRMGTVVLVPAIVGTIVDFLDEGDG